MSTTQIIAIILLVAGVLGLAAGSFSFKEETHEARLGSIELSVKEDKKVDVPLWASVGAIVAGLGLLVVGGKRR